MYIYTLRGLVTPSRWALGDGERYRCAKLRRFGPKPDDARMKEGGSVYRKQALWIQPRGVVAEIDRRVDMQEAIQPNLQIARGRNLSGSSGDMEKAHFPVSADHKQDCGVHTQLVEAQSTMESDVSIHRYIYAHTRQFLVCHIVTSLRRLLLQTDFPDKNNVYKQNCCSFCPDGLSAVRRESRQKKRRVSCKQNKVRSVPCFIQWISHVFSRTLI